jgi:hypothetical protein
VDTAHVAQQLETTTRLLRQFLRSPGSTFVSVGSGARYEFNESDLPTLAKRFNDWRANGKTRNISKVPATPKSPSRGRTSNRADKDRKTWEEEGPVKLEDIRDPRVRLRVKQDAEAAEARLMLRLMAAGLHITQLGDRKSA